MGSRSLYSLPEALPRPLPQWILTAAWLLRASLKLLDLPPSRWRDYAFNYLMFVGVMRRFPRRRLLMNDVLFRVKTGPMLRSEFATFVSDKEFGKRHIKEVLGDRYNVPTLAILRSTEEIDYFVFPERCVIKPTHGSGEVIMRKANEPLDLRQIKDWLELDYYKKSCEVNYRDLIPKIIVEPPVFGKPDPLEFKIYCVAGKVRTFSIHNDRFGDHTVAAFDADWNEITFMNEPGKRRGKFEKPHHLSEIIANAEKLAEGFFFIRIDVYYDGRSILFGEITNCPFGAMRLFHPPEAEIPYSQLLFASVSDDLCENFFRSQSN